MREVQGGNVKYWLRSEIIHRLDKNPEYCWATLVMWSLGYSPFWEIVTDNAKYKYQVCRKGKETGAYCGKCEVTKRFYLNSNKGKRRKYEDKHR